MPAVAQFRVTSCLQTGFNRVFFCGFEFRTYLSVFLGVLKTAAVFLGYLDKLDKCCILIILYFQCYFWVQCYSPEVLQ